MSVDCSASSELFDDGYNLTTENMITMFTFSLNGINDYDETINIIINNCNKVYTEKDDNATFDTYEYDRKSIEKLIQLDKENNYGEYFKAFLNDIIISPYNKFYIKIF
jgi:hypothetical protein